jgi:hypothetical protein
MVDYLSAIRSRPPHGAFATGAKDVRVYAPAIARLPTYDTRVTNHGFKDGTATSFRRCSRPPAVSQPTATVQATGSPLSEPQGDIGDEEFGGAGWQNLNPDSVVTVEKSEVPLEELKLIEVGADTSQGPTPTSGPAPAPVILRDLIGAAMPVVAPDIVLPDDLTDTSIPVQTVRITNSTSTSTTELTTTPSTTTTTESTTTESSTPMATTEIIDTTPEIEPTTRASASDGGEIVPQDGALIVSELDRRAHFLTAPHPQKGSDGTGVHQPPGADTAAAQQLHDGWTKTGMTPTTDDGYPARTGRMALQGTQEGRRGCCVALDVPEVCGAGRDRGSPSLAPNCCR